jgi:hypothetical protein
LHDFVARKRGRPKVLRLTLPLTAYANMGRRERENFRQHVAEILNETDAAAAANYWRVRVASLALEPYGITLVANDRVLHVHREDRQEDRPRRQISGSVWDGRKPIWRTPRVTDHPHKLGKLTKGPKIRYAHRNRKSAEQMAAAKREPFKPRGDDAEAAHALLTAIGHLATRETKRARTYLDEGVITEIMAKRGDVYEPVTFWRARRQNSGYWRGGSGKLTKIPRCTGFVSANEWPIDDLAEELEQLGTGDAWWANLAGTRREEVGDNVVQAREGRGQIYKCGIDQLRFPQISDALTVADIVKLVWWAKINRHRAQMRTKWPQFAFHGEGRRLDRSTPVTTDPGGQCCRWTAGGFKSCPLQCWQRAYRGQK